MSESPEQGAEQGSEDEPLREEDVTREDALDDRVAEGEGLDGDDTAPPS